MSGRVLKTNESMNSEIPFKIFTDSGKFRQAPHSHEYLQIWYVLKGTCLHVLNNHEYSYKRFGLFIVPPYAEHCLISDNPDTLMICCEFSERFINSALTGVERDALFDFAYLEPFFMHERLTDDLFRIKAESQPMVEELFLDLLKHFRTGGKYSMLFVKADLLKLLAIIASEYEASQDHEKVLLLDKYHGAIDRALEYLNQHFAEKVYLDKVCRISLMSQSSFSYIFKQITGYTFSEYLQHLRVSKACDLLKNTDMPAADIAAACGFSDAAYFSTAFRKIFGQTPTRYRKAFAEEQPAE